MRRRDWVTWIFALVIALVLWFYVVSHQNLTRTLQVPVEVTGVPPGMIARPSPAAAAVAVAGPRETVERLTVDNVRVRAPLASNDPGRYVAPLQVTVSRGLSARVTPQRVSVQLERSPDTGARRAKLTSRVLPIVLTVHGQPAPGYRVDSVKLTPPIATVAGEASVVAELRALPTTALDLGGAREQVEARLPFVPPADVAVLYPDSVHVVVKIRQGMPPIEPLPSEEPR